MKSVLKILAFAIAFAAIGQSVYKAYADQSMADYYEKLSAHQRLVELLNEKAEIESTGSVLPLNKRRAIEKTMEEVVKDMKSFESELKREEPAI